MTRRASPPPAAADAAVQLDVTPEVGHVFQASAPEPDEAEAALARTGAFLQAYLQLADQRGRSSRNERVSVLARPAMRL